MTPNSHALFSSWSAEFIARANRVRALIGGKHWLTDGRHKESVLADFLKRYLPKSLVVTSGFVCAPTHEPEPSREIDILIADFEASPPWFSEGGVSIIPPRSLVAQVQVKTSFGDAELLDVLESTATTYSVTDSYIDPARIWSGAFFYSEGDTDSVDKAERLVTRCLEKAKKLEDVGKLGRVLHAPSCIVVLGHFVIVIKSQSAGDPLSSATVSIFSETTLGPAIFLQSLFSHILSLRKQDPDTHLETMIARASLGPARQFVFEWNQN
jgi:hypothetical protein